MENYRERVQREMQRLESEKKEQLTQKKNQEKASGAEVVDALALFDRLGIKEELERVNQEMWGGLGTVTEPERFGNKRYFSYFVGKKKIRLTSNIPRYRLEEEFISERKLGSYDVYSESSRGQAGQEGGTSYPIGRTWGWHNETRKQIVGIRKYPERMFLEVTLSFSNATNDYELRVKDSHISPHISRADGTQTSYHKLELKDWEEPCTESREKDIYGEGRKKSSFFIRDVFLGNNYEGTSMIFRKGSVGLDFIRSFLRDTFTASFLKRTLQSKLPTSYQRKGEEELRDLKLRFGNLKILEG